MKKNEAPGPLYCQNSTFLCKNGGTCSNLTLDRIDSLELIGFECICKEGFTGALCDISK